MNKSEWALILGTILVMGGLYYLIVSHTPDIPSNEGKLLREIKQINSKVDSIRRANDSIKVIIDTTEVKIEHVYEKYIQVREHIAAQSVDSDCVFFSNYLSKDSQRFIDTINFKSAQTY